MLVRGVRGATTAESNTEEAIIKATEDVLQEMIDTNGIQQEYVASILFTSTPDLTACYPAKAARNLGWSQTALLGFQEMDVPDGLKRCIRVLIHWNTDKPIDDVQHVYQRGAEILRPDLTQQNGNKPG